MIVNSQPDGRYFLVADGKRIPFRIERRKRKRLAITVHPDLRLEVVAPADSSAEQVLLRVEKRAGWILRQQQYFEKFLPTHPGSRYVSGETHLYLGRQYRLKVHMASTESVKLVGKFLHVWSSDLEDTGRNRSSVERWYREHAERVFRHRADLLRKQCRALKLSREPRLVLRRMPRRWGSCTKSGNILLNVDLIKAPIHCVDYVIVHELCHLQIHNHSPAFYRLLSRCLPDWERRKRRLEEFVL